MIHEQHKQNIADALTKEKDALGSWAKVATKIGVNVATLHTNIARRENWNSVSDKMWMSVATAIGYKITNNQWTVVDTMNTRIVTRVLNDAQHEAMFMAISEKAGSGKTASINRYKSLDTTGTVFVLQCEEWAKKTFLLKLCTELGVTVRVHSTIEHLTEEVVKFFKQKAKAVNPLLVLDEADKLKPSAIRFLIPLYNRLEDEIGLVVAGTENLKREIQNGVRKAHKGYDEIDSRLGRAYVELVGATITDVRLICEANGITGDEQIKSIWSSCFPQQRTVHGKYIDLVDDLRKVKRLVKSERLRLGRNDSDQPFQQAA